MSVASVAASGRHRSDPRGFQVAITYTPQRARVICTGVLDADSSRQLETVVTGLCRGSHRHIIVDVAALTSLRCRALAALHRAEHHAQAAGGSLTLAGGTGMGRRLRALFYYS